MMMPGTLYSIYSQTVHVVGFRRLSTGKPISAARQLGNGGYLPIPRPNRSAFHLSALVRSIIISSASDSLKRMV